MTLTEIRKEQIAEDVVNHFMGLGATVRKSDYDYVLKKLSNGEQALLKGILEEVGKMKLICKQHGEPKDTDFVCSSCDSFVWFNQALLELSAFIEEAIIYENRKQ